MSSKTKLITLPFLVLLASCQSFYPTFKEGDCVFISNTHEFILVIKSYGGEVYEIKRTDGSLASFYNDEMSFGQNIKVTCEGFEEVIKLNKEKK